MGTRAIEHADAKARADRSQGATNDDAARAVGAVPRATAQARPTSDSRWLANHVSPFDLTLRHRVSA